MLYNWYYYTGSGTLLIAFCFCLRATKVFRTLGRDSHLQFRHEVKQQQLERAVWAHFDEDKRGHEYQRRRSGPVLLMFVCVSSTWPFFSSRAASFPIPVHLIDISCISVVTQKSIEFSTEYKYANLFMWKEKKAPVFACSLFFWARLIWD